MRGFETHHFLVLPASLNDRERLMEIADSWYNKVFIEGEGYDADYIDRCLAKEDLPPIEHASKENFLFFKLMRKSDREIIGFLNCYMKYPDVYTMWIGDFVIEPKYREKGYGREIIEQFVQESIILGFERICLGVHLKNWTGINFWTRLSFDKIVKVVGDRHFGHKRFSIMVLERTI